VLAQAAMVTVMDDREGDIYEKWARLPDAGTQLLTRACRDRNLADWRPIVCDLGEPCRGASRYVFDLAARPGKRSARQATMAVRFGCVRIRRPIHCSDAGAPDKIELFAIEVREFEAPAGSTPLNSSALNTLTPWPGVYFIRRRGAEARPGEQANKNDGGSITPSAFPSSAARKPT
jgi:hypothetical protein